MTALRPLRAVVMLIILVAGIAAMAMSRDFASHRRARPDPFGATLMPVSAGGPILVDSLRSDGAAERAGLHVGDRIEAVDDRTARSRRDVERALATHRPVVLHVRRASRTFALTIASRRS